MMQHRRALLRTALGGTVALATLGFGSVASAMTVQPVIIDLTPGGRGASQVISVENSFQTPLPVELRVEELSFTETGVQGSGKDPGELLIFPPQAIIQPGQTQSFRLQWAGGPLTRSRHFYVTVAQLPVQLPEGQSAIQILYNFQVLVSVGVPNTTSALRLVSASPGKTAEDKPAAILRVSNDSATYGYLSDGRLRVVQKDASGRVIFTRTLANTEIQQSVGFGLVGPGQTRTIVVPLDLPSPTGALEVEFTYERRR